MHFLGCRVSLFVYGTYARERRPSVFGMNGLCGEPSSSHWPPATPASDPKPA